LYFFGGEDLGRPSPFSKKLSGGPTRIPPLQPATINVD
jgi:hypothetical protein